MVYYDDNTMLKKIDSKAFSHTAEVKRALSSNKMSSPQATDVFQLASRHGCHGRSPFSLVGLPGLVTHRKSHIESGHW